MRVLALSLLSSTLLAAPLAAQDYPLEPIIESTSGSYDGRWEGAWQDGETYTGRWHGTYTDLDGHTIAADYRGTFIGEAQFHSDDGLMLYDDGHGQWHQADPREARYRHGAASGSRQAGPNLAYSLDQRAAWLADCRAVMLPVDDGDHHRRRGGRTLGALLGAAVGGFAGNRIAGDGDRLLGTAIGAGAGGLAGAAIGASTDSAADRRSLREREADAAYAAEYCDAYLARYEASAVGGGYALGAHPLAVTTLQRTVAAEQWPCAGCSEVIIEEEDWIDVPTVTYVRRERCAPPPPADGKLTPLR